MSRVNGDGGAVDINKDNYEQFRSKSCTIVVVYGNTSCMLHQR